MGNTSAIQWTDKTWNPWHGCKKISPGCKYCYMFRDKERYGQEPTTVMRSKTTFRDPLKWKEPAKVFTCSWSDFFIEEADEWRDDAWQIIKDTPHLTYQVLTKRPENIADRLPSDWGHGYENVWLGVSVENQEAADTRIPILLDVPTATRFLSIEPLLDAVNVTQYLYTRYHHGGTYHEYNQVDWIIVGGESGNENGKYKYRPCQMKWIMEVVLQGEAARVPVFVKQMGTFIAKAVGYKDSHGGDISEWPEYFQVREFPQ